MARYRARQKARAKAERERLEALEDAAEALGEKLRTMARAPGNPHAHRQAWAEAHRAWRDTFGGLMEGGAVTAAKEAKRLPR